jgi:signal transduction histidine kinase
MTLNNWTSIVSAAGVLTLGFLVLWRGARTQRGAGAHRGPPAQRSPLAQRNPLALPLGLLCIDMFAWIFTSLAYSLSGKVQWYWLTVTFSPLTPPLALQVVLAFVGRLRQLRTALVASYVVFGALALSSAAAFFVPAAGSWAGSRRWSLTVVCLWAPLLLLQGAVLLRHIRAATTSPDEQMRARLLLAAALVGALLGSTEVWDDMVAVPAMGHLAALASMALVALVVLRFRLFGRELSSSVAVYAAALAALSVFGYLAVYRWLGTNSALLLLGTASITLGLLAAGRDALGALSARRERARQLTALGRFSAQMAHDLKNPLAALKGSLQFLQQEAAQGRSLDAQREFMELMAEQVDRLEQVIERYQRLSRVEPRLAPLAVGEVVAEVVAGALASRRALPEGVEIQQELDEGLPECLADRDLLASVVENLVRNACEAMPAGGRLTVRAKAATMGDGAAGVQLVVEDSGQGMDARQRERAFDDFYTTKAEGSGLGLAFARRVVEAHGGAIRLDSALGRGTTVTLLLPCRGPGTPERGKGETE